MFLTLGILGYITRIRMIEPLRVRLLALLGWVFGVLSLEGFVVTSQMAARWKPIADAWQLQQYRRLPFQCDTLVDTAYERAYRTYGAVSKLSIASAVIGGVLIFSVALWLILRPPSRV